MSVARNRAALSTITPIPALAATISAATSVVQPKAIATRMPVRISGSAALMTTCQTTCRESRSHRVRRVDLLDRHRAHPGAGVDRDGRETREVDQEELAGLPDPEPDDGQREVGERRDRTVELDRRVEDAAGMAAHAHRDADGHRGDGREEEGEEDAIQAPEDVLVQGVLAEAVAHGLDLRPDAKHDEQLLEVVVRAGDLVELRDHQLRGRQEQRPDQLQIGDEPPASEDSP